MLDLVIKCRRTPVSAERFMVSLGQEAHVEFIPPMIVNALFVANGHRADTRLHLVFELSDDYSRILTFDGTKLGDLGGLTESSLLGVCAKLLKAGARLDKEESIEVEDGLYVRAASFERWVKALVAHAPAFLLDPKGGELKEEMPLEDAVVVMTDQLQLPKNTRKGLLRMGLKPVSLGNQMLLASQCITLVHAQMDAEGAPA